MAKIRINFQCQACKKELDAKLMKPPFLTPSFLTSVCPNCETKWHVRVSRNTNNHSTKKINLEVKLLEYGPKLMALLKKQDVNNGLLDSNKVDSRNDGISDAHDIDGIPKT